MKKALLAVSFGTSYQDTLEKNIAAIEKDLAAGLPDRVLFRAFTSAMIINKLRKRDGIAILNVAQALEKLSDEGYTDLIVQPTHVLNGDEYEKLRALAMPYECRFGRISYGTPLLTEVADYHETARAVLALLPAQKGGHRACFYGARFRAPRKCCLLHAGICFSRYGQDGY